MTVMVDYKLVNDYDCNIEIFLDAVDEDSAIHEALEILGWRVVEQTE